LWILPAKAVNLEKRCHNFIRTSIHHGYDFDPILKENYYTPALGHDQNLEVRSNFHSKSDRRNRIHHPNRIGKIVFIQK